MDIIVFLKDSYMSVHATVTESNTSVKDSFMVKKVSDMKFVLNCIRNSTDNSYAVHKRSMFGMINEWRAHNLLYTLGIQKERTGTVDLDTREPWYRKIGYFLLSPLYFNFL